MKLLTNLQDYRPYPALHYSLLSRLDTKPKSFESEEKDFTDALKMGSLVDVLLTSPADFDNIFYVLNENKPTSSSLILVEEAIKRLDSFEINNVIKTLYEVKEDLGLWNKLVNEDIIKSKIENPQIIQTIKEHFDMIGKIPIFADEKIKAEKLLEVLKNHNFTKKFFNTDDTSVEIKFQVPIVFSEGKYNYKCLLDGIIIDKWNKQITPFDLKTSEDSVFQFPNKVFKWRYDLQAALYLQGITHFRDKFYPDYKINDFLFVVGSFSSPDRPLIYNSKNIINVGTNGGYIKGRYFKGYKQLSEEYFWHREHNCWDYKKEIYESAGIVDLNYNEE